MILKTRNGEELTDDELSRFIDDYSRGQIPDYQVAAWLMAVVFNGLTRRETGVLTRSMIESGDTIDLSSLPGPLVDKHSTGGVGDTVSLILAPLAAACGLQVPMMSGRALGHTGGTLDKLESIPGYRTDLDPERFRSIIAECGFAMTGQSERIVPADRKLYALRDATGTVESVSLITGSILSKKFAEGAEALVFDVKCGSGAFMKNPEKARVLAESLCSAGRELGRTVHALITRMDQPLGWAVGNRLEVEEAVSCLQGDRSMTADGAERSEVPKIGPDSGSRKSRASVTGQATDSERGFGAGSEDLMEVTLRLLGWMLFAGGIVGDISEGMALGRAKLADGSAYRCFLHNVELQGGDVEKLRKLIGKRTAPHARPIRAGRDGVVHAIDSFAVGTGAALLGVGRPVAGAEVLPDVGVVFHCKVGAAVREGDEIAVLYGHEESTLEDAVRRIAPGIEIRSGEDTVADEKAAAGMILEEISAE